MIMMLIYYLIISLTVYKKGYVLGNELGLYHSQPNKGNVKVTKTLPDITAWFPTFPIFTILKLNITNS